MGFPAEGIDASVRNSKSEICEFLKKRHGCLVKVYNLCIEESRYYPQKSMPDFGLANFGFCDHNICSTRTIFEVCLDIFLFI